MGEASHLTESAARALLLAPPERIAYIRRGRWIGYTRAKKILGWLEELLRPSEERAHSEPPARGRHQQRQDDARAPLREAPSGRRTADGGVRIPVLVVQAPPVPDESRFYAALLEAIHPIERLSGRLAARQLQVVRRLRLVKVGLLIVDEIHHVLAGHTARQRQFLNVLKYLGNALELPIVGVGIKEALRAIQTDPQLANRFEPVALPRWEMNEDFLMLLASFERMLPLRERSKLTRPALAQELLTLSEGTIGELATLLAAAAAEAVRSERERIDEAAVSAVGWTRPSERPRRVEQLV